MAEDGFLKRWSRRKLGGPEAAPEPPAKPVAASAAASATPEPDIDPATLPPIDSLDAASDYTIFLRKGVPEAIRNAALRRAWVTDPVIRDFRTPADYDWDFNAPGYGALDPSVDVNKLADEILGRGRVDAAETAPAPAPAAPQPQPQPTSLTPAPPPPAEAPPPAAPDIVYSEPPPPRRKRGGALPQ